MTSWHSYGKVYNLGHKAVTELFDGPVVIEEKVDGSQFSFGLFDGEIKCRSRNKEMNIESPVGMFQEAAITVAGLKDKLHPGWTYRGEYLRTPKHNALAYDRVPKGHIIIFDIAVGEEDYLPYIDKANEAERLGLEVVPIISAGKVESAEELEKFLERDSTLGGQKIEGVVIKNYDRFGPDKKILMGKHVSEKYREMHDKKWVGERTGPRAIIDQISEALATEARWEKAVQHLRDRGELEGEPRDIGKLIVEAQNDIGEECEDMIKDMLYVWAIRNIRKGAVRGLAEWYKGKLLEQQFADKS